MRTMSERLIHLREKHHFSQTDVAKILNVTSALISAYEKCERKPSIDKLIS
jgi:transcriptional regulator with XRE-family HTH domain